MTAAVWLSANASCWISLGAQQQPWCTGNFAEYFCLCCQGCSHSNVVRTSPGSRICRPGLQRRPTVAVQHAGSICLKQPSLLQRAFCAECMRTANAQTHTVDAQTYACRCKHPWCCATCVHFPPLCFLGCYALTEDVLSWLVPHFFVCVCLCSLAETKEEDEGGEGQTQLEKRRFKAMVQATRNAITGECGRTPNAHFVPS